MSLNDFNKPDNSKEKNEKPVNKPDEKLEYTFIKKFVQEKQTNPTEFVNFFNKIKTLSDSGLTTEIKDELKKFAIRYDKEFNWLDFDKIDKFGLLKELIKQWWKEIENSKDSLNKIYEDLYDINEEQKTLIKSKINNNCSLYDLRKLLNSESSRNDFLKNVCKLKNLTKKDIKNVFKAIKSINFDSLDEETKKSLEDFYISWYEDDKLIDLLKNNTLFSLEQKKDLIQTFIPTIKLNELEEMWIYTKEKVDNCIDEYLKSFCVKNSLTLDDAQKKELKDLISSKDINITTKDLFLDPVISTEENLNKILEENKLANVFKETRENYNKIQSKKNFYNQINSDDFDTKIEWLKDIKNWDVICAKFTDPQEDKTFDIYLKIEEITDTEWIKVTDLTCRSWKWALKSKDENKKTEMWTYDDLIRFCKNVNSGHIKSEAIFDKEIENNTITSFVPEDQMNTVEELKKYIDFEDPKWINFWLQIGTIFEFACKDSNKVAIWKITEIWSNTITVQSNQKQTFSFEEFLKVFTQNESKRKAIINNTPDLLTALKSHENTQKDFESIFFDEKKNAFSIENQKDNKDFNWIKYFVSTQWKWLYIEEFSEWQIKCVIWDDDKKENTREMKHKWAKNPISITDTVFDMKNKTKVTMTPEIFYAYITKFKLKPNLQCTNLKLNSKDTDTKMKDKFSLMSYLKWKPSPLTLFLWAKQIIDSITETMKEQSELQAAELALSMGKVLPLWIRNDLQMKVESVWKKKCEEKKWKLKEMWPDQALEFVYQRLMTSNLEQYEYEAMLIYVVDIQWCLYPSKKLSKEQNNFIWFKRLAWIPLNQSLEWDPTYEKYIKEQLNKNKSIDEADLIIKLFQEQTDWKRKPYRRTSIVKEFWKSRDAQINEVKEGWYKQCESRESTVLWRINYAAWQFKSWNDFMAIWAMKKVFATWWTLKEMSYLPFIVVMSWIGKNIREAELTKLIQELWWGNNMPILSYLSDTRDIDFFQNIVVKLAREKIWPDAEKKALQIIKWADRWVCLENAEIFWKEYWDTLAPYLNGTNTELLLMKEKDSDYDKIMHYANSVSKNHTFTKDLYDNWIYESWHSNLFLAGGAEYLNKAIPHIRAHQAITPWWPEAHFKTFLNDLNTIKNLKWTSNEETEILQKKSFKYFNWEMVKFLQTNGIYKEDLEQNKTWWWIELLKSWLWIPYKDNWHWENIYLDFDYKLEEAFNNFKNNTTSNNIKNNIVEINAKKVRDFQIQKLNKEKKVLEKKSQIEADKIKEQIDDDDYDEAI